MKYDVITAHEFSSENRPALEKDKRCGCFYCGRIFDPVEIKEWIKLDSQTDASATAFCPYCGIDSVIGESSGYPITTDFLREMHQYWFGGSDNAVSDHSK